MRTGSRLRSRVSTMVAPLVLALACSGTKFATNTECAACAGDAATGGAGGDSGEPSAEGGGGSEGKAGRGMGASAGEGAPGGGPDAGSGGQARGGAPGVAGGGGSSGVTDGGAGGAETTDEFPRTRVLDDFNREGPLLGDAWLGETAEFSLSEQAVWCENCTAAALWAEPFGERQEVFATLREFDHGAAEINLVLKAQGSPSCDLIEVLYAPATSSIRIAYCAHSQWFDLDETPLLVRAGDRLGARAHPNGEIELFHNEQFVKRYDVSDFPFKFGRIGLSGVAGDNGLTWDDFGGGELD